MENCLGRLRVGNETGPRARIRMGMATDMQCRWCDDEDGTEHRLFDCQWPTLRTARATARGRLAKINKGRYSFSLATLVGLWGVLKADQAAVLMVLADMIREVPGMLEGFMETRRVVRPSTAKGRGARKSRTGKHRTPLTSNGSRRRKPIASPAIEAGQQLLTRYWGSVLPSSTQAQVQDPDAQAPPVPVPDTPPASLSAFTLHRKSKDTNAPLGNEHLTQIPSWEYKEWLAQPEDLVTPHLQRLAAYQQPRAQEPWWAAPSMMSDVTRDWWNQRMQKVGATPYYDDSGG